MSSCPNCGHPSDSTDLFCQNCGAPLSAAPAGKGPAFCMNCGERLIPGAAFCANCGVPIAREPAAQPEQPVQPTQPAQPKQPVQPEQPVQPTQPVQPEQPVQTGGAGQTAPPPTPAKKGRGKRGLIIGAVAAAAAAVVGLCVLLIPLLLTTPDKQFVSYQQDLLLDRALSLLEEGVDTFGTGQFSSNLTLTADTDNSYINDYLEDSSIALSLDLDRDTLQASTEVNLMGSPILSGFLSYEQGQLGFYLPEIQDTYYTMDLSQTIEAVTGQQVDLSVLTLPQLSGQEWRSLLQSYLDVVYTVVNQDNVTVTKNTSFYLSYLNQSATGTVYTFQPRAQDVEAMLLKLAQTLREDETLRQLILKLINPDMLTAAFGPDIFDGYDLETQLDDALLELAAELEENAWEIGREVEESGFTWELWMEGSNVRMIRLFTDLSDTMLVYEAAGQESDSRQEVFYVSQYGEPQVSLTHTYSKSGSTLSGTVEIFPYYQPSIRLDYQMDKDQKSPLGIPMGSYDLSVDGLGIAFSLNVVEAGIGSVDHTLLLQVDPSYTDGTFSQLELNLNATRQASVAFPPTFPVDISSYSYGEYQALFEELGSALYEDLVRNLEPLIYSAYGW